MNIDVKQRVVGAIVLVSLAVIFLPLLLPGKGDFSVSVDESNIPPTPDYRFPPIDEAPEAPAASGQMMVPLGIPATQGVTEEAASAEPTTSGDMASQVDASVSAEAEPSEPPAAEKTLPVAKNLPTAEDVSGWVVQLGSFSSQNNALALRDKLRAKGYTTFVEPVESKSKTVYRVRIGPELSREAADKLRQKLKQEMKMQGLVQKYP